MSKRDIYIINTLSNGGAERVVVNLANESSKGSNAIIITLYPSQNNYLIDDKVKIVSLLNNKPSKILRILLIPYIVCKLNKILSIYFKDNQINCASVHLRFMQFVISLTKFSNKFIYVLHESLFVHQDKWWFRLHLNILYKNKYISAVSKGVENEIRNIFGVSVKQSTTIYNPIPVSSIHYKAFYNTDLKSQNYFLFCGRLEDIKNPLEMIRIFYEGDFYKQYNLYFCGVGELYDDIIKLSKDYGIDSSVKMLGWCSNPYEYMANAKIMINCSKSEAFPMSLIEALCCECKVVSYDINYGPNEILTNSLSKYLVQDKNRELMINIIQEALYSYPDNLSNYALKYDVINILNNYYNYYENIIKGADDY